MVILCTKLLFYLHTETKQILNLLCKKSAKETLTKKSVPNPVITKMDLKQNSQNNPYMALEWKNFNIKLRVLDQEYHGKNGEFEIYPKLSKYMPSSENLKRKRPIGGSTLNRYITASSRNGKSRC